MRFTYDNSSANLNASSAQRVKWGPQSSDEMAALWLEVLPRRSEDVPALIRDYSERSLKPTPRAPRCRFAHHPLRSARARFPGDEVSAGAA